MAVKLSALSAGPLYPPGRYLVFISVRGWVDHRAIVRLEWLGELKSSTSSGLESATFRLVAYCLNQPRYREQIELLHYDFSGPVSSRAIQQVSQTISQPVDDQSVEQLVSRLASQWITHSVYQPGNRSANQWNSHSVERPVSRSASQLISKTGNQVVSRAAIQPIVQLSSSINFWISCCNVKRETVKFLNENIFNNSHRGCLYQPPGAPVQLHAQYQNLKHDLAAKLLRTYELYLKGQRPINFFTSAEPVNVRRIWLHLLSGFGSSLPAVTCLVTT
jgi:hypothetical protein